MRLEDFLTPYMKKKTNLSKWVRGLNIRPERIENIAEHFAYKS